MRPAAEPLCVNIVKKDLVRLQCAPGIYLHIYVLHLYFSSVFQAPRGVSGALVPVELLLS